MLDWLLPILGGLYWTAAILALVGGLYRNHIAWPLLLSFGFYQTAQWQGWEFDRDLWAAVDCVVLLGIAAVLLREFFTRRGWLPSIGDWFVLALFVPLLVAYTLDPAPAHLLSMTAGSAQLLLVFPAKRVWQGLRASANDIVDRRDEFDLLVTA